MTADQEQFQTLAAELRDLQDGTKSKQAAIMERVLDAGFDPSGVRRFVAWKRQDEEKRAQREAIDQQCRYLAGERDTPAELPIGCELHRALNCYRRKLTVRQAAEELSVSTGKAGNLYKLARMFAVHVHADVDKSKVDVILPPEVEALPAHDPATGGLLGVTSPAEGIGHNSKRACISPRPAAWHEITAAREEAEAEWAAEAARKEAERIAVIERKRLAREAEAAENARIDADMLEFPARLRRGPPRASEAQTSQSDTK